MVKLCVYHSSCIDGFGSAWVVRRKYPDAEFHGGVYSKAPPDVTGRDVIIVDFSYKRDVLLDMASKAKSILILDHHKSAQEDLVDLPDNVTTVFDMTRSGCRITWDYYFPSEAIPQTLLHIEDRDLWLFKLDNTREVAASVFSFPYDFAVWDELMAKDVQLLAQEGSAIDRKHKKDIAELLTTMKRTMVIGGYTVPVANLPYTYGSDAASEMAKTAPFAACYWDTATGRVFGLRSTTLGKDVSEIAGMYSGGGHRGASGFKMPIGWSGDTKWDLFKRKAKALVLPYLYYFR